MPVDADLEVTNGFETSTLLTVCQFYGLKQFPFLHPLIVFMLFHWT